MWYVILACVFSLAAGNHASGNTLKDLIDSVNTSSKIWLYDRSYLEFTEKYSHDCLYHQKIYLNDHLYVFHEGYGEQVRESVLYATLCQDRTSKKGVMKVGKSFGDVGTAYTLEYWDSQNLCSVFTFEEGATKRCEMYVWDNAFGKKDLKDCIAVYWQHCNTHYIVYSDKCPTWHASPKPRSYNHSCG